MKRVILSSVITAKYDPDRLTQRQILRELLTSNYPKFVKLSPTLQARVLDAVLRWKSSHDAVFHHWDVVKTHNDSSNITLLTRSAHGYIHTSKVFQAAENAAGEADVPHFSSGKLAGQRNTRILEALGELVNISKYSSDVLLKFLCDGNVSNLLDSFMSMKYESKEQYKEAQQELMDNIVAYLDSCKIPILQTHEIDNALSDFLDKYSVDVNYVDDDIASRVMSYLTRIAKEPNIRGSKMRMKSIESIKSFISNNSMDIEEIANDHFGDKSYFLQGKN